ncbi:MAG: nuclear transport factor 2 family protein [Minwuia sp.]|uniref:nuclear transport factor 2 family protein n=1 Tax=Minwuia sp. TaxID=2493630 RepID=UPI003A8C09E6
MMDAETVIDTYCAIWNTTDPVERKRLLGEIWSEGGVYCDPTVRVEGAAALLDHIAGVHSKFEGFGLRRIGKLDQHHGLGRFGWQRAMRDGSTGPESIDFVEFDAAGRLKAVIGFFGPLPG